MTTIIDGDYEWDDLKSATNEEKHEVTFREAAAALADANAVPLPASLTAPDNCKSLARGPKGVLVIVHTVGTDQRLRIISARQAEPKEEKKYLAGG